MHKRELTTRMIALFLAEYSSFYYIANELSKRRMSFKHIGRTIWREWNVLKEAFFDVYLLRSFYDGDIVYVLLGLFGSSFNLLLLTGYKIYGRDISL